jgi:hypothetical protein
MGYVGYVFCPNNAVEDIKSIDGIKIVDCNGGDDVIRSIIKKFFLNDLSFQETHS